MEDEYYDHSSNKTNDDKPIVSAGEDFASDITVLRNLISILNGLERKSMIKMIKMIITFFELDYIDFSDMNANKKLFRAEDTNRLQKASFSEDRSLSPKQFLLEKKPMTEVERIACLGYYLSHYRKQTEFKTSDLVELNIEAAQLKFSIPKRAVDNATRHSKLLVPTKKGYKQLSAIGEQYVQALPDRDEARNILTESRPKRKKTKSKLYKNK